MAGVRIAATSGPPLLLELLSLLPGVVGNKVGYAEEGANDGEEGEEEEDVDDDEEENDE